MENRARCSAPCQPTPDLSGCLSEDIKLEGGEGAPAIFTLLAIVVATSLLNGDLANGHRGDRPGSGLDQSGPRQNGHEEAHPHPHSEELATPVEHSSSSRSTEGAAESPGINEKVESNANNPLRYLPGKARSHHLEMMMSKDELEEEQRVQREQLAAIFQLLKDNKETFGEVTEGDMEEQLKLYSI
uniref:matrix-remodeling-associated protein 7-like n=1 Tax=Scatophagus argus TaxID=75038 RepID=UPI001ED8466F|nr:matrix-remodeling-associated protein 7-like [Scatophagus argus]